MNLTSKPFTLRKHNSNVFLHFDPWALKSIIIINDDNNNINRNASRISERADRTIHFTFYYFILPPTSDYWRCKFIRIFHYFLLSAFIPYMFNVWALCICGFISVAALHYLRSICRCMSANVFCIFRFSIFKTFIYIRISSQGSWTHGTCAALSFFS